MEFKPFSISTILKHSRQSLKGSKAAIWGVSLSGLVLTFVAAFVIFFLISLMYRGFLQGEQLTPTMQLIQQLILIIIVSIIFAPFLAGSFMVVIQRARCETVTAGSGFYHFKHWMPLTLALFSISLLIVLVSSIINHLLLPWLFATVRPMHMASVYSLLYGALLFSLILTLIIKTFFLFSLPLIIDRHKTWWCALIESCRLVAKHWFKMFILVIINMAIMIITLLPAVLAALCPLFIVKLLGLAASIAILAWSFPYMFLIIGHAYVELAD